MRAQSRLQENAYDRLSHRWDVTVTIVIIILVIIYITIILLQVGQQE